MPASSSRQSWVWWGQAGAAHSNAVVPHGEVGFLSLGNWGVGATCSADLQRAAEHLTSQLWSWRFWHIGGEVIASRCTGAAKRFKELLGAFSREPI